MIERDDNTSARRTADVEDPDDAQRTLEDELVAHPHDSLMKYVFTNERDAIAHLRGILPAELLAELELEALELMPGSFVSEALRDRHTDLLYQIPRRIADDRRAAGAAPDEEVLVYVLHEHQRTVDPTMASRLLEYMACVWRRWQDGHPKAERLPPIIPIVLYHGKEPWTAAVRFEDLVVTSRMEIEQSSTPKFEYQLVRLEPVAPTELWGTARGRLTLYLFAHIDDDDLEAMVRGALALFSAVAAQLGEREIRVFVLYVCSATSRKADEALSVVQSELRGIATEDVVASVAKQLIDRGREQGRKEGRRALLNVAAHFATSDELVELGAIEDIDELEHRVVALADAARNGRDEDT